MDPTKESGIIGCSKRGKKGRKLPGKPLHLAVGQLQEDVNTSHPCGERFRILEWSTALTGIHPGKESIPLIDEVKREIELTALDQPLIIYTPVASVRIRAAPAFFLWHGRPAGAPVIFTVLARRPELVNTAWKGKNDNKLSRFDLRGAMAGRKYFYGGYEIVRRGGRAQKNYRIPKISPSILRGFHMKMLLLTNDYPMPTNPMSDVFITKRLKEISQYDIDFDAFGIVCDESALLRLGRRILNKPKVDSLEGINFIETAGVRYNYIHIPIGLLQILSTRVNPSRLAMIYAERLCQVVNPENYDFIHAHSTYPVGYVACLTKHKYNIPYVLTAHGSDIHTLPCTQPKLKPAILETLESADKVIFVSNALRRKAMELGYDGENAVVISNGVDVSSFSILDKDDIRKRNGVYEPDMHYVGFVGNLIPVKRVDKLPEIFLNIREKVSNVKFLIVGDGGLRDSIQEIFTATDLDVVFAGRVKPEMVPFWMNCMDCLVLPSRNEGWGNVVLEAQACGVPVVGSNAGGIPEAVGEGGLIVEEGADFEERFAGAVCTVLRNPPNAEKLRERAQRYGWGNIVRKEVEVYWSLLW